MTADPRLVAEARIIDHLTYNVCQLAYEGAVIHPRAVEVAMQYNVPLIVKHLSEDTAGTLSVMIFMSLVKSISRNPAGSLPDWPIFPGWCRCLWKWQLMMPKLNWNFLTV